MVSFSLIYSKGHWTLVSGTKRVVFFNKPKIEALTLALVDVGKECGQLAVCTNKGVVAEVIALPCMELPKVRRGVRSYDRIPFTPTPLAKRSETS